MAYKEKIIKKQFEWGDRQFSLEIGKLAFQTASSVLARYGDTMVLVTVVSAPPKEEVDFFPLTVDYEERLYAAGKIPGSRFIKREGRPSEEAILTARLIDRSIRPIFPKNYLWDVQVIVTVLSYDQENEPDILALMATSAALTISPIPWEGPILAAKVGFKDGQFILNPTRTEVSFSDLELVVSFKGDKVVMIETAGKEISEDIILEAIKFAREKLKPVEGVIQELQKEVGSEKVFPETKVADEKVVDEVKEFIKAGFKEKLWSEEKASEEHAAPDFKKEIYEKFEGKLTKTEMSKIFDKTVKEIMRKKIVDDEKRPDGRKLDELRDLELEVGILPRTHGSALYRKGETQILTAATLGSTSLEQLIEGLSGEETKRFIHHYTFPPFSTGEVRRLGPAGRREVGHGALVEKSLLPMIPGEDKFPYTIRLVSEVLSSSGSTSMGSVCASSLALMDAGVPISKPVAGVSIGLVEEDKKHVVLMDIQALEDFYGDMDFKVSGTLDGITAIQLDVKNQGISLDLVKEALGKAKLGREKNLEEILKVIPKSREEISVYAPRIKVIQIPQNKIGEVIGSGGRTINKIIAETGAAIDIEDDGTVMISSTEDEKAEKAAEWIESLVKEVKVGEVYSGQVKKVMPFGAFVEILPGKDGLVHISNLATHRIEDINREVEVGDTFKVKVIEVDRQGKISLAKLH